MAENRKSDVFTNLRKKNYVKPAMEIEKFVPNEYVNACYGIDKLVASAYCVLPGDNTTTKDGSTPSGWEDGRYKDSRGNWYGYGPEHGTCANGNTITIIRGNTGSGSETGDKSGVSLDGLVIGEEASETAAVTSSIGTAPEQLQIGSWYKATWTSEWAGVTYHHVGLLHIESGTPYHDTANRS